MIPFRMILASVGAVAFASIAHAQAAVEYAAKSSGLPGAGSEVHVGACPVDSMLIPCVRQFYPAAFYIGIIAVGVALLFLLYPKRRA